MPKITSLTPDEENTLKRLGKKLPKELKRQDRQASSPVKKGSDAKPTPVKQDTMKAQGDGSPGANMGHTSKATPVKITAKQVKERS